MLVRQATKIIRLTAATTAIATIALSLFAQSLHAHEIPTSVVINAYLKPDGNQLTLLLRVPLAAMRDVDFPIYGPGYLDIDNADDFLYDAAEIWLANFIDVYEQDRVIDAWEIVAARITQPSDRSFVDFDTAMSVFGLPRLGNARQLYREQALLDVHIRYAIDAEESTFSIEPDLARLGQATTVVLRFLPAGGSERLFEFSGSPGLIDLDPRWHQAFIRFVGIGIEHILDGIDHLLFVLCLILPFRRLRPLIVIVTSFTAAHSITLMSSAFGFVPAVGWFPALIETLIAASIVYMAIENVVGSRWERRWLIAFGFGLVHGFGFSFALNQTLQFAGAHLVTSLLAFNLGVEIGQIFVILLALPILNLVLRTPRAERVGALILSILLAHSGWHWMLERAADLSRYSLRLPRLDLVLLATTMRWLMFVLLVGLVLWFMNSIYKKFLAEDRHRN